jgi:hypothetical protein
MIYQILIYLGLGGVLHNSFSAVTILIIIIKIIILIINYTQSGSCDISQRMIRKCCSAVVKALCHKPEGRGFETR